MAMIDYGAIAFKNGKLVSTAMFSPMKDMVGWEDRATDIYHDYNTHKDRLLALNGNYFAYIGDSECTIAFYKERLVIVGKSDKTYTYKDEWFNCNGYTWSKWEDYAGSEKVKVTKRNGYLVCRWKYKGDKYKVYFGYGVDFDYYKKWHMVNYYRSLRYRVHKIKTWFKDKIYEWKYRR